MSLTNLITLCSIIIMICCAELYGANRSSSCSLEIVPSPNTNQATPFTINTLLEFKFDINRIAGPADCYKTSFEFKQKNKTNHSGFEYQEVHSFGQLHQMSFVTTPSSLTIEPFTRPYEGYYKFVVTVNSTIIKYYEFTALAPIVDPTADNKDAVDLLPPCFLPLVYDIKATMSNTSKSIELQWQSTTKEDPNIKYCKGSKRWQVKALKYSKIQDTMGDHKIDNSTIEWITVPNRDTMYTFTEDITENTYYSFQVGHLEKHNYDPTDEQTDNDIKPLVFASHVYYFGEQAPASIQIPTDNTFKLPVGSSRSIHCDVGGIPVPSVKWIRESGAPPMVRQNDSAVLELEHVTQADAGVYYCIAFNILVNPPNGKRDEVDTWKITVIVEDYDVSKTGVSCRTLPLDSSVCKSYVYTGLTIYTNHTVTESSIDREDRAIDLTSVINYDIALGVCRDLAYSMMCHNVYPYCDVVPGIPTPRKLCNNVCQEFKTGKCKDYLPRESSLYEMLVNGCDDHEFTGGQSPECIPLSYQTYRTDQIESIEDTGNCIRDDGRGYSGNEYRTESGYLCQSWTKQTPHRHPMLPELYRTDLDQAHFSCRNPGGIGNRPWCYTNNPLVRWEYCSISKCDSCEIYKGETCKTLEGYANMNVTIKRTKQLQSQQHIEEKISLFSRSILFLQPTEGCKNILRVLLCHGAFPQCTASSNKQLCSIYCQFNQALENLCPNVYTEFSTFMQTNQYFLNKADCSLKEEPQCMTIQIIPAATIQEDTEAIEATHKDNCYEGNGISYNGTISQTREGIQCQAWDAQTPHSHPITSAQYPELINSNNYCRNPGNLKERPWCYTTHNDIVWDYCEIKHCSSLDVEKNQGGQPNDELILSDNPNKGETASGAIIATMSIVVTILIALMGVAFTGCYCFLSRKNRRAKALLESEFRLSKMTREAFEGEKYVTNADYTKVQAAKRSQSLVIPENFRLLNSKDIKYVSQLGQGNFGIVFKGKSFGIKDGAENDEGIDVAVKTLKEEASSEVKQDFIDEAKLMFSFDHPNILKIHGVCMSEMPYQLVFEYMDEGDLTKFLRSRASSHQRRLINPFSYRSRTESSFSNDPASLTKTELLYICKQIADGMKYLAENKHVHRDLACRNCLIKSDLVVKIGDFGMSRNLYSKDYYRINGNAVLPVRWMSPESLIYGKFSVEGDVWSFGIVMWEIFSFALQPYYGITNEEVTEAIRRGKTLNRPDDCPIEIYRLMKECWTLDPAERISFPELWDSLSSLHQLASLSGSIGEKFTDDEDDAFSDNSDMPSDAFYSEEYLDNISNTLEAEEDL